MEPISHTYIVLPSNASTNIYPKNTPQHYTVKLAKELHLTDGSWEVGLSEIHYPNTWVNFEGKLVLEMVTNYKITNKTVRAADVNEQDARAFYDRKRRLAHAQRIVGKVNKNLKHRYTEEQIQAARETLREKKQPVPDPSPAGYRQSRPEYAVPKLGSGDDRLEKHIYEKDNVIKVVVEPDVFNSVPIFVQHLNASIARATYNVMPSAGGDETLPPDVYLPVKFQYDVQTHKITLVKYDQRVRIKFTEGANILQLLGFDVELGRLCRVPLATSRPATLRTDYPALFVYCSLVRQQLVGHSQVQVIRTIPVESSERPVVHDRFQKMYYMPLNRKEFDEIEIKVCNECGDLIQFNGGMVICVLHLRRRGIM